jgi:Malectin domain
VTGWSGSIESPSVGAIGTSEYVAPAEAGCEAERRELDWLITSGVLGRSGNLIRVLKYICEERFAGRAHQIKEYKIAIEALGRRPDFDPNTDTIVRVTFHSLRKRLLEVYQAEGANRPIRLIVPPGHYDPHFISAPPSEPPSGLPPQQNSSDDTGLVGQDRVDTPLPRHPSGRVRLWYIGALAFCLAIAVCALWWARNQQNKGAHQSQLASAAGALSLPAPQATIRVLMGSNRQPYVDHSGTTWATSNYCQGGTNVTVPPQKIEGTLDAPLYLSGVRGIAHCVFPVTQKLYELHFHFAETSDLLPATRLATISVNAGPAIGVDVVDAAGGNGIATSTVVTDVAPENDGSIHVDFTSEISLLDAVEILPAPSPGLLPVRIVVNPKPYVDSANQLWAADRYFSGGRYGLPPESATRKNLGLYESDRIGRFRYNIPAVPLAHYRVRLYFREPWFGKENGGIGGPGSRVFDVACNGEMLLKNFDILATGGSAPVVKTFDNIQATAAGRIELSFMPVVNYPMVNAIEILPEN